MTFYDLIEFLSTLDKETLGLVGSESTHFIEKLFKFDPATRITVEQALAHSYLTAYFDEDKVSKENL
ncbi:hypothetical protein C2G38_2220730 [Gigaspora rosea]|uniref:Protein kinase domain-containing protein n=1 Tax=Gigaspora rosea TaxID=44941 RepID=A0A397UD37_9GLOM|nr:hypothetical protein C2G38_2220730 [Gigaspora rosea]